MITQEQLDKLEALTEAATPGPWYAHNTDDTSFMNVYAVTTSPIEPDFQYDNEATHEEVVAVTLFQYPRIACHKADRWDEDAAFIAAARNTMPQLLAEVRRLQAIERAAKAYRVEMKAMLDATERELEEHDTEMTDARHDIMGDVVWCKDGVELDKALGNWE